MTKLYKHPRDGWTANTDYLLEGDYLLRISTSKCPRGGVSTTATRYKRTGDGCLSLALGVNGDFYETVLAQKTRATEKAVRVQHEEALTHLEQINVRMSAHYDKLRYEGRSIL